MKAVTKCHNADRYKAMKPTKCQCFVCQTKWRLAELERQNQELQVMLKDSISASRYAASCADGALYVANLSR